MLGFDALGKLALGQLSGVAAASAITAETGALVVSGQEMASVVTMPADAAAVTVTGQSAGLVVSMRAEAGTLTITGQTVVTTAAYRLAVGPFVAQEDTQFGVAALGAIALGQLYADSANSISFEVTGGEVMFRHAMAAEAGAVAISGGAANLVEGNVLTADHCDIIVTFHPIATTITLPLGAGSLVITGQGQVELSRRSPKLRRFPRAGTTTISARSVGAGMRARAYGG